MGELKKQLKEKEAENSRLSAENETLRVVQTTTEKLTAQYGNFSDQIKIAWQTNISSHEHMIRKLENQIAELRAENKAYQSLLIDEVKTSRGKVSPILAPCSP